MTTNIKLLSDKARIPTRGSEYAAGYDLYAAESVTIPSHTTRKVSTDIAIELPIGTFGGVFPRSGLATKRGLRCSNCVGVIDEDYRGGIIVALYNDSDIPQLVEEGERIAQLIAIPYLTMEFKPTDELNPSIRGEGGFGSTGSN